MNKETERTSEQGSEQGSEQDQQIIDSLTKSKKCLCDIHNIRKKERLIDHNGLGQVRGEDTGIK